MKSKEDQKPESNESNMVGLGVAMGVSIGTAIGVATDNLGLWLSMGVALGTAIGVSMSTPSAEEISGDENKASK